MNNPTANQPQTTLTIDERAELKNMRDGNGWGYPLPGTSRVIWDALAHLCELGLARAVEAKDDPYDDLGVMFWYAITPAGCNILKERQS